MLELHNRSELETVASNTHTQCQYFFCWFSRHVTTFSSHVLEIENPEKPFRMKNFVEKMQGNFFIHF